jgi:hypothetical protein
MKKARGGEVLEDWRDGINFEMGNWNGNIGLVNG